MLEAARERATAEEIPCESILALDDRPYMSIVREARERKISLLVVGSHGRSGLQALLMGSVCRDVIGHAPCPVLVVPGRPLPREAGGGEQ